MMATKKKQLYYISNYFSLKMVVEPTSRQSVADQSLISH